MLKILNWIAAVTYNMNLAYYVGSKSCIWCKASKALRYSILPPSRISLNARLAIWANVDLI